MKFLILAVTLASATAQTDLPRSFAARQREGETASIQWHVEASGAHQHGSSGRIAGERWPMRRAAVTPVRGGGDGGPLVENTVTVIMLNWERPQNVLRIGEEPICLHALS